MLTNFHTYQLSKKLYQKCTKLKVKYHVRGQLERSSLSVCLNLAEGSGKASIKDRRRFYHIALGSLREVYAVLDTHNLPLEQCNYLGACIWKLIRNPGELKIPDS